MAFKLSNYGNTEIKEDDIKKSPSTGFNLSNYGGVKTADKPEPVKKQIDPMGMSVGIGIKIPQPPKRKISPEIAKIIESKLTDRLAEPKTTLDFLKQPYEQSAKQFKEEYGTELNPLSYYYNIGVDKTKKRELPIKEFAKGMIKIPFQIGKSINELFGSSKEPLKIPKLGEVYSYQQEAKKIIESGTPKWAAYTQTSLKALLDIAIIFGIVYEQFGKVDYKVAQNSGMVKKTATNILGKNPAKWKSRYYDIAKKTHPDKLGNISKVSEFKEATEAYALLSKKPVNISLKASTMDKMSKWMNDIKNKVATYNPQVPAETKLLPSSTIIPQTTPPITPPVKPTLEQQKQALEQKRQVLEQTTGVPAKPQVEAITAKQAVEKKELKTTDLELEAKKYSNAEIVADKLGIKLEPEKQKKGTVRFELSGDNKTIRFPEGFDLSSEKGQKSLLHEIGHFIDEPIMTGGVMKTNIDAKRFRSKFSLPNREILSKNRKYINDRTEETIHTINFRLKKDGKVIKFTSMEDLKNDKEISIAVKNKFIRSFDKAVKKYQDYHQQPPELFANGFREFIINREEMKLDAPELYDMYNNIFVNDKRLTDIWTKATQAKPAEVIRKPKEIVKPDMLHIDSPEEFLKIYSKEEFGQQPRFVQQMIASKYGLKPEAKIRAKETQKLVDAQAGRTLQMAPDKAPNYFWSDSRDLYKEITDKTTKGVRETKPMKVKKEITPAEARINFDKTWKEAYKNRQVEKAETTLDLHKKSIQAENDYREWLKQQPDAQKEIKDIQENYDTIPLTQAKARKDFLKNAKHKLDTKFSKKYAEIIKETKPEVKKVEKKLEETKKVYHATNKIIKDGILKAGEYSTKNYFGEGIYLGSNKGIYPGKNIIETTIPKGLKTLDLTKVNNADLFLNNVSRKINIPIEKTGMGIYEDLRLMASKSSDIKVRQAVDEITKGYEAIKSPLEYEGQFELVVRKQQLPTKATQAKPEVKRVEAELPQVKKTTEPIREFKSTEVKEALDELKELSKNEEGFISLKPATTIIEALKSTEKQPSEYETFKDVWLGKKDLKELEINVETRKLQNIIKGILGKKKYDTTSKNYDKAIQLYIDSKRNPDDLTKYYSKLTDAQKEIVDLSKNLPTEIKEVAKYISDEYKVIGNEALDAEIIKNVLENYAGRIWDLDKGSSENFRKFGTTTRHAKQRTLTTIVEGWSKGLKLKVEGATNNLNILKSEINKTIIDKNFIKNLSKIRTIDGDPIITTKKLDGYVEVKHPNFSVWKPAGADAEDISVFKSARNFFKTDDGIIMERKTLYTPKDVAKNINNILGVSSLKDLPGIHTITKYNAILKAWILQTSLFHHFAFARSYFLGTHGKTLRELKLITAYKDGIKMMEDMSDVVKIGVKNGLTLGVKQDWSEELLREKTMIGNALDKLKVTKIVKDKVLGLRQQQADFLFGELGAGLKVKAFEIELRNLIKKYPGEDMNKLAKMSANLINDDFGGLHLQRMGRNPTLQHIFRLFALAPDWTESNIRSMVKTIKAGGKKERKMYRKFWAGILTKGTLLTVLSNLFMAGFDKDDEKTKNIWDRFVRNYKTAWQEGRLLWTGVDITPLYKIFGGKTDERKYFSILGHFIDPLKFIIHPFTSAQHKGSVVFNMFFNALKGSDYAQRSYTTYKELFGIDKEKGYYKTTREGHYEKGDPKFGKLKGKTVSYKFGSSGTINYGQLPSYLLNQLRGTQPVQIQNLISWIGGELEGFDAILNSMGIGIKSTYDLTDESLKGKAKNTDTENGMVSLIKLYIKAFGVDPLSAMETLFTKEQLKDVRGGAVIMERMGIDTSQAIKKKGGAGATDKLDHTVPLELGGNNSEKNLKIVTEEEWKSYTPVENYLGNLLNKKKITESEAKKLIKDFKDGKITFEEIKNK